jgi:hypothetical protein
MILHLVKRAVSSFSNATPEISTAFSSFLLPDELKLWSTMPGRDQRHSIQVLKRFLVLYPEATRAQGAAALLHDLGKVQSGLGWFGRIVATVVGPRTKRFRLYHLHEELGAGMLWGVSEAETVALVRGEGSVIVVAALLEADNI